MQPREQLLQVAHPIVAQPPHGGIGLRLFLDERSAHGGSHLADGDDLRVQIHTAPFESADLAAPQPQIARQLDGGLDLRACTAAKQLAQLRGIVVAVAWQHLGRRRNIARHVFPQQSLPDGGLQRRVQQHMVLAHGVVGESLFQQLRVVPLQLRRLQLRQLHLAQRGHKVESDDVLVTVDGGLFAVRADKIPQPDLQPVGENDLAAVARALERAQAQKFRQGALGIIETVEGAHAAVARAVGPHPVVHRDVVKVLLIIVGKISFDGFSHIRSPSFWNGGSISPIERNEKRRRFLRRRF